MDIFLKIKYLSYLILCIFPEKRLSRPLNLPYQELSNYVTAAAAAALSGFSESIAH